jgi:hypothetical protein
LSYKKIGKIFKLELQLIQQTSQTSAKKIKQRALNKSNIQVK